MIISGRISEYERDMDNIGFCKWESDALGYGYGSGEKHALGALKSFFACFDHQYDYRDLESNLGGGIAWLLINLLCHEDVLEYGTSPRFGWLTSKGEELRDFISSHSVDELTDIIEDHTNEYAG